ncbi:MAG: hypothetical protein IT429_26655 [Gemmataceae bacterium]|nr:hypothetical protein [Gemmataceae bacterium]
MSPPASGAPRPLPTWLVVAGSAAIVFHLGTVATRALSAQSGMWFVPNFGPSMAEPPTFAKVIDEVTNRNYLYPLKMTHDYHFPSNRPALPGIEFEARFKDRDGKLVTLKFPDAKANPWVRHRQHVLAAALGNDIPVQPPQGEVIAAPGQEVRQVQIWDIGPEGALQLKTVPEHLVPRNRPVARPNEWALLLARAYARYLAREYGAASVEIVRRSQDPIPPGVMFAPVAPPANAFPVLVANFGELPR